uniref:Uncharacterized protein n=1 Tax=Rhizophora mucronata TaxID=61149 RepID=A0A2P2JGH8_RHIMU
MPYAPLINNGVNCAIVPPNFYTFIIFFFQNKNPSIIQTQEDLSIFVDLTIIACQKATTFTMPNH